ncbi:MAG: hypothetical protein KDA81_07725 [Planctomycetaceae bacterium]|nr:hypothetical protein [Planctomycetaceae bacterium]
MSATQSELSVQLESADRLIRECRRLRENRLQILAQRKEHRDSHEEEVRRLCSHADQELKQRRSQIEAAGVQSKETMLYDSRSRLESAEEQYRSETRQLMFRLEDGRAKLEEQRRSETWILQSVLDEDQDDSPATRFDREVETFVTQKAFLDERFELLDQQLEESRAFLASCHTSDEITIPTPQVPSVSRTELRDLATEAADAVLTDGAELRRMHLPHWVRGFRIWGFSLLAFLLIWIPVIAAKADLMAFVNPELNQPDFRWAAVAALIAASVVLLASLILLMIIQSRLRRKFEALLQHTSNARHARELWERRSEKHIDRMEAGAEQWRNEVSRRRAEQTQRIHAEIDQRLADLLRETEERQRQLDSEIERQRLQTGREKLTREAEITEGVSRSLQQADEESAERLRSVLQHAEAEFSTTEEQLQQSMNAVVERWRSLQSQLQSLCHRAVQNGVSTRHWPSTADNNWRLPAAMPRYLSVADLLVTAPQLPESERDERPANLCLEMPALLRCPGDTSLLVEHDSAGREVAISFIRRQILKLLTTIPAGRIRLTLIDPVGLGQSFSAMMHLTDYDELLINSRIWTESSQIRDQLQKVTEHMENIFQTYLRSQFDSIEEYNASAGEVAEPYHFVVVAGFPVGFSEEAARHLSSILTSGPRCGVHALIATNPSVSVPPSFDRDDLLNHCRRFRVIGSEIQPEPPPGEGVVFEVFPEPAAAEYVSLVRQVGEQSRDARRVEVAFSRIAPRSEEIWSHSTADGIDLPIGRAGAARLQYMRLGRGTSQHVLVAGKTGSGKSTFLHILITNLALHYSPDEIQFYLIDFKKGVEFRTYAANRLPHARVVAIESDREFGLSVLERLDEILQERGELFRERGVQDVPAFRREIPGEPMPRLLLLIDEFQEFFVAEDRVSARASLLLDRLVRQGRAFGIHVLLGSQTLGGAYSLARSTMGQIAVRIALQCSEADAHLILSEDNMAARLLTRPGEAIYNDANGLVQGNHSFQIAWLDESRREQAIDEMKALQRRGTVSDYGMIVFEGHVAPVPELCGPLNASLRSAEDATRKPVDALKIWMGEPVSISAPTSLELRRASGQNVLIVGQDEKTVDSLLAYTTLSACLGPSSHHSEPELRRKLFLLFDGRDPAHLEQFRTLVDTVHAEQVSLHSADQCEALVQNVHHLMLQRETNSALNAAEEVLLIVRNLGQFRSLRREEDDYGLGGFGEPKAATTASMFSDIIKRGPAVGVHVVLWSDTFNNAIRWISNSLLREFETRIAFRMNQTDSASLIDSPVAASLGPGRAIVYRDQTGTTEKFRPFAWPSPEWLRGLVAESSPTVCDDDLDINSFTIE